MTPPIPGGQAARPLAAELRKLANDALDLSYDLRRFRDEHAGDMCPGDFDYVTELGVELAAYAAILLKVPAEQITWLQRVNDLAAATLRRLEEDHA